MSTNPFQQARKIARVRRLFAAALVLGCALGTVTNAAAQKIASPKTPDGLHQGRETPHSWKAMLSARKAIPACPRAMVAPPGTPTPARKPPYLWISSESRCRSLLTSPASMKIPTTPPPYRYPSEATRRGRALLTRARCGRQRPDRSMPAPTRVARIRGRFLVCSCSQSEIRRGPRAASSLPKSPSSND